MPWLRHRLRDADVWAKVDGNGALITDSGGRVEIVYKAATGARVYRAGARNLAAVPGSAPLDFEAGESAERTEGVARPAATNKGAARTTNARPAEVPSNAIHVWTDGACSGNPGPAGLGVVIVTDGARREISEYLGEATNNIAELTAILRGLQAVRDAARPVVVYSDSAYSIGLLSQNWKAKKNVELVQELREECRRFPDLRFVKVLAHSGIELNERVDQLATGAISRRGNSDRTIDAAQP